jgi:hypothetical protein
MADEGPGRITYGISVAIATVTGAVIGFAVCAFVAVLVMAGLDAAVGIEPPDLDAVPDTAGEWVLAVAVLASVVAGAVIGSRHPAEARPAP